MPFFKKRKSSTINNNNQLPDPVENGNGTTNTTNKVVSATVPPLQDFLPPPDVVADALAKTNRRSTLSVADIMIWGRDYFCAFVKNEGFQDLYDAWETSGKLKEEEEDEDNKTADNINQNFKERLLFLKSQLEGMSLNLELTKLDELGEVKDCLTWVTEVHNKLDVQLQETCLQKYLESKYHVKCQMDLFTNGSSVSLYDVLLNQSALFYFMEYAEQEGKREVLEFWLAASNFSEQFSTSYSGMNNSTIIDVKTAVSDAMVLYEKYISLQAPHPLGIRDEIRSEIEAKICSQDEVCHCFNNAIVEAFAFLHVSCLEGFLKSSLFLSFLSDLIGSMNSSKPTHQNHDSSSVGSSGSVKSYPVSTSSSLTSPTLMRERGKLTMGRVNALGKFEADVGWEMFKKESSIAKTVKKFVNYDDKEKAKEDLAWQVAAMIVNEVTSVTMGPGLPSAGETNL